MTSPATPRRAAPEPRSGTVPAPRAARSFAAALAAVALLGLALRSFGLAGQPPLGDDVSVGVSAVNYVERAQIGPTMWHHPRLRDLAVYPSLATLGPTKLGLVLPSLLLGVLAIPLVGLLGRRLAGERAGLLAAFLVAIDALAIAYSRQAVQEIYPLAFGAGAVLLALEHHRRGGLGWLAASGAAFGVGAASKWSAAFALPAVAGWLAWRLWREERDPRRRAARLAYVGVALGAVPLATYALTWAPWLVGGRDLLDLVRLHGTMAAEAATHAGFNPATIEAPHRAALWFLAPGTYADAAIGPSGPVRYLAATSPLTWLLVLPGVAATAWRARRAGDPRDALLVALVLASWLPFAATSRPIWIHSALAVVPFAFVAVAALVVRAAEAAGARARVVVATYAAIAAAVALPLYLLAAGIGTGAAPLRGVVERFRPTTTQGEAPR